MSTLKDPLVAREGWFSLHRQLAPSPPGSPSFYPAGYSDQPHPWHLITLQPQASSLGAKPLIEKTAKVTTFFWHGSLDEEEGTLS
ncbi:hypothetical protein HZH68_002440 [Vespula germanica]|uniref:Uncharacterized protein n=2 Tax=Vespula TaxID=7451 RepID=A0A834U0G2_VESGE|nr:hypothetical protein HZH66_002193 [Vespula vulgaris]KAF7413951.1 hypothetical protein HZH68_002440 [Vespula germanica]